MRTYDETRLVFGERKIEETMRKDVRMERRTKKRQKNEARGGKRIKSREK